MSLVLTSLVDIARNLAPFGGILVVREIVCNTILFVFIHQSIEISIMWLTL